MSETKHTPGPWQKKRNISSVAVLDNSGGLVARLPATEWDIEKQDDNARLIAAAPELLEVLRYIEGVALANEPRDLPTIAAKARAAIDKATGETE